MDYTKCELDETIVNQQTSFALATGYSSFQIDEKEAARRAAHAAQMRNYRLNRNIFDSPELIAQRRAQEAERMRNHRQRCKRRETPEQAAERRAKNALRMRQLRNAQKMELEMMKKEHGEMFELAGAIASNVVQDRPENKPSLPPIGSCFNEVSSAPCPEIYEQKCPTITPTTLVRPYESENVAIKWKYYDMNVRSHFQALLHNEQYVDVKLSAEGRIIKCHKVILSSFSSYFEEVFKDTPLGHIPVIFLKGVPYWILELLVEYMYVGEFIVEEDKLPQIFSVATELKIRGLEQQNTFCTSKSNVPEASMTRQGDFGMSCSESESDAAPSAQRNGGDETVSFFKHLKLTPSNHLNSQTSLTPNNPVCQTMDAEQIIISPTIVGQIKSEPPDLEIEDTKVSVVTGLEPKQDKSSYEQNTSPNADGVDNPPPPGFGNYIIHK